MFNFPVRAMLASARLPALCSLVWVVAAQDVGGTGGRWVGLPEGCVNQMDMMLSQMVDQSLAGCHLVLATAAEDAQEFSLILRRLAGISQAVTVADAKSMFLESQPTRDHLLQSLWGDTRSSCRALIFHTGSSNAALAVRFLQASGLWLLPDTPAVIIGSPAVRGTILHHPSLRNTIHVLYLSGSQAVAPAPFMVREKRLPVERSECVKLYRRCLYCNRGEMGVQLLQQLNMSSHVHWHDILFSEKLQNFMGHTLRVVTLSYFPFIAYEKDSADTDGPLLPLDSLDIRILNTIATHLNFGYEMREPRDRTWGVPLTGGNWSGIVGTLQRHKADFSLNLTPSAPRMKVISHSRIYSHDPLLIVSLKPGTLPRHLALLRPFEGEVWMMIIMCTAAFGVVLWLLQKTWSLASGQHSIGLESACFYIWAVLLAEPSTDSPANISGQVFVGSWLLSCVVIGTGYRSSLVSHLSVQSKSLPINTFQDLLSRDGWYWGGIQFGGTTFLYFNQSTDPDIQEIYRDMQIYDLEQGMERVLAGGFSYIAYKTDIKVKVSSLYYDRYGNTPLHLSTTKYPIFGGNSWGFRQGAPFLSQFRRMKQRLIEAGLIDYWLDDVIETEVRDIRGNRVVAEERVYSEVDGQVVLGLDHLQGVFYLLLAGYIAALVTFIGEHIDHYHSPPQKSHLLG